MAKALRRSWLRNSPLQHANYRNLWIGQAISTFGDRFTSIALPILVFELTGSSFQLGIAFALQVAAAVIFGLYAGALSDRLDRRRIMIGSDVVRAVLVVMIPLLLTVNLSASVKLAAVYVLSFIIAAVGQPFMPAKVSLIPQTVPENKLVAANALDQGTTRFTEFLGYSLAGILIAWTSTSTAFYIDAATFLLSALFIGRIKPTVSAETAQPSSKPSIVTSIREGLTQALSTPLLRAVLLLGLIVPMAFGGLQPLLLVFSERVLESGSVGFGLINASMALGSAVGFFVAGRLIGDRFRGYLLSFGVLFLGIFQLLGIIVPEWLKPLVSAEGATMWGIPIEEYDVLLLVAALPFFLLTTFANSAITLGIRTIVQEATPNKLIGRVFSVVGVSSSVAIALGSMTTGLADVYTVSQVMVVWCVMLIAVGVVAVIHPALRPKKAQPAIVD